MIQPNPLFWATLEQFVTSSQIIVDRPKGSLHPRFPNIVYPLDYGFLEGTTGGDGDGIDVWFGTGESRGVTGVACTADPFKRDAELKILLGCSSQDFATLEHFFRVTAELPAIIVSRSES
ncbi:MAG: inorganic pyrophosphatase [Pleurocapsa sp. SU_196_0]|nr:inorganic pyrophosphatase [Pleurocapsa sp. SU_196_0]